MRRANCHVPWGAIERLPAAQVRTLNRQAAQLRKEASERSIRNIKQNRGDVNLSFNKSTFVRATRRVAGTASSTASIGARSQSSR